MNDNFIQRSHSSRSDDGDELCCFIHVRNIIMIALQCDSVVKTRNWKEYNA